MDGAQLFVFLPLEDFCHLAFSKAVEPLRIANLVSGRELCIWSFASEDGETATASSGAQLLVHRDLKAIPARDRLFVLSGIGVTNRTRRRESSLR